MGLFNFFFGKKETPKAYVEIKVVNEDSERNCNLSNELKEIVLLSLSERFKVDEKQYPHYITNEYAIPFPNEIFKKLSNKGLIRYSSPSETLPYLTLPELKKIAANKELKTSGIKDDICNRIMEGIPEEELDKMLPARYWKITETGREELEKYKYISFYFEKHKYSLREIGYDIDSYCKIFSNNNSGNVRDILWGEFNKRSSEFYLSAMKNGDFSYYCGLLRIMSLFIEEEGKYKDALRMYVRYLHYQMNFRVSLKVLQHYRIFNGYKKEKEAFDDSLDWLCKEAELYPFMKNDILELCNECGFESEELKGFLKEYLSKEKDEGLFDSDSLMNLIMFGLYDDKDNIRKICNEALRKGIKRMK